MTAVVVCRSSDGGSPIIAALSTPPGFGCSWAYAANADPSTRTHARRILTMSGAPFGGAEPLFQDLADRGDDRIGIGGHELLERRAERDRHVRARPARDE